MSKIVFVLGAGASFHSGTPLMNNFLEVAEDLFRSGEVEEVKTDFENVFGAVGKLHAAQSKAIIDTYNIEDVYAAFEMGKLLGRLPGIEAADKLERLTSSIRKVIGYTLEKTTKLRYGKSGEIEPPRSYHEFTGIIDSLIKKNNGCSIITFNYDLGLDYSLHVGRKILPDYGLSDVALSDKKFVTYLKLHGSLNWGKCRKCKRIIPHRAFDTSIHKPGTNYSILPIISQLKKQKCCDEMLEDDPFIVPPTWNKTAFHEQIEPVWRQAALELKDAECIFVLGYSFPNTDMFFRYLFALGVDMSTILRGFYVYDTDTAVMGRFQSLLGSGIIQRFYYYEIPFETAVTHVNYGSMDIQTIPTILNIA